MKLEILERNLEESLEETKYNYNKKPSKDSSLLTFCYTS